MPPLLSTAEREMTAAASSASISPLLSTLTAVVGVNTAAHIISDLIKLIVEFARSPPSYFIHHYCGCSSVYRLEADPFAYFTAERKCKLTKLSEVTGQFAANEDASETVIGMPVTPATFCGGSYYFLAAMRLFDTNASADTVVIAAFTATAPKPVAVVEVPDQHNSRGYDSCELLSVDQTSTLIVIGGHIDQPLSYNLHSREWSKEAIPSTKSLKIDYEPAAFALTLPHNIPAIFLLGGHDNRDLDDSDESGEHSLVPYRLTFSEGSAGEWVECGPLIRAMQYATGTVIGSTIIVAAEGEESFGESGGATTFPLLRLHAVSTVSSQQRWAHQRIGSAGVLPAVFASDPSADSDCRMVVVIDSIDRVGSDTADLRVSWINPNGGKDALTELLPCEMTTAVVTVEK